MLAARGLAIFAAGLFKKVVIADNLAQFVTPVFAHLDAGGGVTTPWAWLATLAYTLQIYFDFSGYSDMAIGLALMFGIRLPVNFRSPYKATSIIEFWRRWHITLSRFLRDYLYIPLGGNRLGESRRYHQSDGDDAARRALARRGLEFCHLGRAARPLSLHQSCVARWRGEGATNSAGDEAVSWAVTFFAVVIAWVFFRAKTAAGAWQMLQPVRLRGRQLRLCVAGNFAADGSAHSGWRAMLLLIGGCIVALALAIALCLPNVPQLFGYREYRHAPEQGPSCAGGRTAHGRCSRRWRSRFRCSACGSGWNFCTFSFELQISSWPGLSRPSTSWRPHLQPSS